MGALFASSYTILYIVSDQIHLFAASVVFSVLFDNSQSCLICFGSIHEVLKSSSFFVAASKSDTYKTKHKLCEAEPKANERQ